MNLLTITILLDSTSFKNTPSEPLPTYSIYLHDTKLLLGALLFSTLPSLTPRALALAHELKSPTSYTGPFPPSNQARGKQNHSQSIQIS
jgi:hypothetical protein